MKRRAGLGIVRSHLPCGETIMFARTLKTTAAALAVLAGAATMTAPAEAKGCLRGAAAGAVAGHVAGHHAVAGALVGCAVVHHHYAKTAKLQHH